MKTLSAPSFFNMFLAFSVAMTSSAFAKDGKTIFNGKNLDGWDGDPKFWKVEDGAIVGQTTKETPTKGNTFIIWKGGELKDFDLSLDFKIENHNSGIQYRSFVKPGKHDAWRIGGYQPISRVATAIRVSATAKGQGVAFFQIAVFTPRLP